MVNQLLTVKQCGMVSGLGLSAKASGAAMLAGFDNFEETRFMDKGGEWILASQVPLDGLTGISKLLEMLTMAIDECLPHDTSQRAKTIPKLPLLLCLSERERPGRITELENTLFNALAKKLNASFHPDSKILVDGKVGGVVALQLANDLVYKHNHSEVLIAGVDSLINTVTLSCLEDEDRILTSDNSNGFIPGEGAAAILVGKPQQGEGFRLHCIASGFAKEQAIIGSDTPLRAEGLSQAIKQALTNANCTMQEIDFRVADINGEHYYFKEAALALTRVMREVKEEFDIWDPVSNVGEVGAAILPMIFCLLQYACDKSFAPGHNVLVHTGNDAGKRAACIIGYRDLGNSTGAQT